MNRTSLPLAAITRIPGLELLLLALAYYCAARIGLQFAFQHTNISPLWPPSGLAVAAAIWRGPRVWPAIACGAFAANLATFLSAHAPLPLALLVSGVIAGGNTLEALLATSLLGRFHAASETVDDFAHPQGVVRFAALAGALSCAIPATIGALCVRLGGIGGSSDTMYLWWTWWTGDVAGVMMVAPAILAWRQRDGLPLRERGGEAALLWASATAMSVWVFGLMPLAGLRLYPLGYLVMPFLLWAAFRFGRIGASLAVLWVGGIAAWGTAHGGGPFYVQSLNESLLLLQTFMGVVAMTTLVLSGALSEQRAAQDSLEARIAARTVELRESHAQLATSFARLQESETLRDNLMHMIVHDLRMPLSALHYALRALTTAGELPARQQNALDISKQSAQTLSHIIANLLDIHQLESGALALQLKTMSPSAMVENAVTQVAFLADYKGLKMVCNVAPDLPALNVDPEKLGRVLTNLLDNAIRLTPSGGTITIGATLSSPLQDDEPIAVQFAVSDTGPGIPSEAFERIFEKFGQVKAEANGEKSSSGLGLTFCQMIVEAHGGEIWVQSQLQQGSRFYFTVPVSFEGLGS
ncbi:adaptive-response sensory-kinase SasA [Abditibacteriota bacterium]|nr:adaptive-response sensory-kinase SasA [Abditibacteriota bacterium]